MYSKETVYNAHLTSKKHVKAAAALENGNGNAQAAPETNGNGAASTSTSKNRDAERSHYLARLEAMIQALTSSSWLAPIRGDTKSNVERKAALTDKERMQELQDMEKREAEEAAKAHADGSKRQKDAEEMDVEEEKIYNPLKLPLGWDGKPIPFVCFSVDPFFTRKDFCTDLGSAVQWLYKLHGLGVEYECEICSNAKCEFPVDFFCKCLC